MTNSPERLDPTLGLAARAEGVAEELAAQQKAWSGGSTRRRFLAGLGMAGVATLGSQLVTTKAAFAAPTAAGRGNTLINICLRGGADGLRMLVPVSSTLGGDYLSSVRPGLLPGSATLLALPGSGGWALNAHFAALLPYWNSGEMCVIPGVSNAGISRSHFQAQQFLDSGGQSAIRTGWMDRMIAQLGPGSTFRAIGEGSVAPVSMLGTERKLVLSSLAGFSVPGKRGAEQRTGAAIESLYRGLHGSLPDAVQETLGALATAAPVRAARVAAPTTTYPSGDLGRSLKDLAALLKSEVGVQVAAIDVGGWDTHSNEAPQLDAHILDLSKALDAFLRDLGRSRRSRVTIVVTTEFGRRVAQNGSGGSDHGHGGVMLVLGGGLARSQVAGRWDKLSADTISQGDVPAWNDPFQVYAELASTRLGLAAPRSVFAALDPAPLRICRAS